MARGRGESQEDGRAELLAAQAPADGDVRAAGAGERPGCSCVFGPVPLRRGYPEGVPPVGSPLPHLIRRRRGHVPLWRRVICAFAGAALVVAGFVGLVMPGIPGFILLVPGLVLLAVASRMLTHWINAGERRLPEPWRRGLRRMAAKLPLGGLKRRLLLPRGARASGSPHTPSTRG